MTHALLRNITAFNPCMVRGEGIYLFDSDGKRYIDGASGSALVCNIGHGVMEVAAALGPDLAGIGAQFVCRARVESARVSIRELIELTTGDGGAVSIRGTG